MQQHFLMCSCINKILFHSYCTVFPTKGNTHSATCSGKSQLVYGDIKERKSSKCIQTVVSNCQSLQKSGLAQESYWITCSKSSRPTFPESWSSLPTIGSLDAIWPLSCTGKLQICRLTNINKVMWIENSYWCKSQLITTLLSFQFLSVLSAGVRYGRVHISSRKQHHAWSEVAGHLGILRLERILYRKIIQIITYFQAFTRPDVDVRWRILRHQFVKEIGRIGFVWATPPGMNGSKTGEHYGKL